jgi:predicted amidophosphoribosyltransferase
LPPGSSRLLELAAKVRAARCHRNKPEPEPVGEVLTWTQFWQKVRTTYSKEQRIDLMMSLAKFHKTPWEKDPQVYQWALEKGLCRANSGQ